MQFGVEVELVVVVVVEMGEQVIEGVVVFGGYVFGCREVDC